MRTHALIKTVTGALCVFMLLTICEKDENLGLKPKDVMNKPRSFSAFAFFHPQDLMIPECSSVAIFYTYFNGIASGGQVGSGLRFP